MLLAGNGCCQTRSVHELKRVVGPNRLLALVARPQKRGVVLHSGKQNPLFGKRRELSAMLRLGHGRFYHLTLSFR